MLNCEVPAADSVASKFEVNFFWAKVTKATKTNDTAKGTSILPQLQLCKCEMKGNHTFSYSNSLELTATLQQQCYHHINTFKSALKTFLFNLHEADELISV